MFYDKNLMNSEVLGSVWKLANEMATENIEENNLPRICNELDTWVNSEAEQVPERLSLRASSNFIGGAAKLYKQGISKLFDDINKLDDDIIWRRKRERTQSSSALENSSSESCATPEQMRRQADTGFDTTLSSCKKRKRTKTNSLSRISPTFTMSRSSGSASTNCEDSRCGSNHLSPENIDKFGNSEVSLENMDTFSTEDNGLVPDIKDLQKNTSRQRKDKGQQTSPILNSKDKTNSNLREGFDTQLPFGYILIHDDLRSRIPNKIIFTSINRDIQNLI